MTTATETIQPPETLQSTEEIRPRTGRGTKTMRATVFHGVNDLRVEEVPRPTAGFGEAVIRVTLTTICGTDLHIVRGEYPVRPGLIIGHEPVGVIEELGPGVTGYEVGDRVLVGAITPCGQCRACLSGQLSQCGHGGGYEALGGWRFGNTIHGAQAEYLLVPNAQANLAKIPDELTDEQVVLLADIASTGFSGAESGKVRIGDAVVVFAQGPIGLCATAGAKLMGAGLIIGVDGDDTRLAMSRRMGADVVLDFRKVDVVEEVKKLTGGGVDVAIEALGTQQTFENALRCLRPGRHPVEPGRLLRQAPDALRRLRRRPRRPPHRDHPLPGRQGADAAPARDRPPRPGGPDPAAHPHLPARPHQRGLHPLRRAPGRRAQGGDPAVERVSAESAGFLSGVPFRGAPGASHSGRPI